MGRNRKKPIPDGWMDYSSANAPLQDARIVPFKCPLPDRVFHQQQPGCEWTPSMTKHRFPQLRLIVDLTNKFPAYYDPEEFEALGVRFLKVACVGHDVPSDEAYVRFRDAMQRFYEEHREGLVGVHCTHGVNRTGYIVCRFLVEMRGYLPQEALEAFAACRGHPVERENYIEALRKISPSSNQH